MELTTWLFAGFVATVVAVYYVLPQRAQNAWLLIASIVFYVIWAWQFAITLAVVTAANMVIAHLLIRGGQKRPGWLWAGIGANLAVLAFFKYADFFVPQALAFLNSTNLVNDAIKIILPVGLSYTILQMISYLVD